MKTILVPVDFSETTTPVIETAGKLARAFQSRLVLLHVSEFPPDLIGFEPGPMTISPPEPMREPEVEMRRLDELKRRIEVESNLDVLARHVRGPIADVVLDEADEQQAGMIVMGSHGHGALYHLLVGSATNGVLKRATCPVVVVPALTEKAAEAASPLISQPLAAQ